MDEKIEIIIKTITEDSGNDNRSGATRFFERQVVYKGEVIYSDRMDPIKSSHDSGHLSEFLNWLFNLGPYYHHAHYPQDQRTPPYKTQASSRTEPIAPAKLPPLATTRIRIRRATPTHNRCIRLLRKIYAAFVSAPLYTEGPDALLELFLLLLRKGFFPCEDYLIRYTQTTQGLLPQAKIEQRITQKEDCITQTLVASLEGKPLFQAQLTLSIQGNDAILQTALVPVLPS